MKRVIKKETKPEMNIFDSRTGRLRKALSTLTFLIERGNEDLWPLYEIIEDELIKFEQRQKRFSRNDKFYCS